MGLHLWTQSTADYRVLQCVFIEKNPDVSGPVQFKSMLLKGQLYLAIRKNDILPFSTIWMDFESIMLNEIN